VSGWVGSLRAWRLAGAGGLWRFCAGWGCVVWLGLVAAVVLWLVLLGAGAALGWLLLGAAWGWLLVWGWCCWGLFFFLCVFY